MKRYLLLLVLFILAFAGNSYGQVPGVPTSDSPVCSGATLHLYGAPAGMTAYSWTGPDGFTSTDQNPTITNMTVAKAGTYKLMVDNGSGFGTEGTTDVVVNATVAASVSIAESANNVCAGTSVTFTATPVNEGTTPVYQWYNGAAAVGSDSPTYTYTPADGDAISVVMTSNATCVTGSPATSNTVNMVVNATVAASVLIAESANNVCAGTSVTFTATPTNGGTPVYQWYNGAAAVGSDSPTYTYTPANGDAISVVMTSNATCVTGSPATSNTVNMVVNATVAASVSIAESANNVCAGTSVTFTATPTNGGTPVYQWYKGASPVGTNSATYSYTPVNGDAISVVMTSNAGCVTGSPATSNTVTMTVNPNLPVSVSILPSANPSCEGSSVTFTATPTNGGGTPSYQWYNGSTPVGTNSSTYSYVPLTGENISVVMTSSLTCKTGSPATSNTITMTVNPLTGTPSFTAGATEVCNTAADETYTATAAYSNSIAYSSSPSDAGSINPGTGVMNWDSNFSGIATITATANGDCGTTTKNIYVTVYDGVPTRPASISGSNVVCQGQTGVAYTAATSSNTNYYEWTVPAAQGTIVSGQGTTTIVVDFSPTATDHSISVKSQNSCGLSSSARTYSITVKPTPTASISGTTTVCQGAGTPSVTFTNPMTRDLTITYNINGADQATITVNNNSTASISAPTATAGTFTYILVSAAYATGTTCMSPLTGTATVTVTPTVGTPSPITVSSGADPACQLTNGTTTTTYTTSASNATSYTWSLSNAAAGSINSSGVMTWNNGFYGSVDIRVVANGCGTSSMVTRTVTVTQAVGTPDAITIASGSEPSCQLPDGSTVTNYSTTAARSTGLNWSLSNGAAGYIDPSTGSMTWASGFSGSVNIQVTATGCGTSPMVTHTVNITPNVGTPTAITITSGTDPTCQLTNGTTETDYNTTASNASSFTWSLSNPLAGVINGSTGLMTWADEFSGNVDIRVYATGCNGNSTQVTRSVSVTPAVGTPSDIIIAAGIEPTCQPTSGTTITIYSTTATNSTGFTWSLNNAAAGSINPSTGYMTWTNGFSGAVDIEVVANGCGTSVKKIRPVIVYPLPTISISGPASPRINSTGNLYTTQPGMSSYIWTLSGGGTGVISSETYTINWNTTGNQTLTVNYTDSHGCTKVNPEPYNVTIKPLPSVSDVIISGYPAVGNTLTGSYLYADGNGGDNNCITRWLRNGTVEVGTGLTYIPVAADVNKTLTFEVTPVSTVGPPYTGTVVSSTPTALVEDLTGKPSAEEVCIEGIRQVGNTLRGDYHYVFSKTEGISTYKWYRKNLTTMVSTEIATTRQYTLTSADVDDNIDIIFEVTPVSSNIIPIIGDPVLSNPLAKILISKAEFSVSEPDVTLQTNQPGGIFSGSGVSGNIFSPNSAGSAGSPYTLSYFLNIVNTNTACAQQSSKVVTVNPNVSFFVGFDAQYCKDGGQDVITVSGVPTGASIVGFSITGNKGIVSESGTTVTIDPGLMRPGVNKDYLYFAYNYLGTYYQISQGFSIDSVGTAFKLLNLKPEYCAADAKQYVSVEGVYPAGGSASWTGSILSDPKPSSVYADPSLGTPGQSYPLSYQYTALSGCKSAILRDTVTINPMPNPSFSLNKTYNIDDGVISLVPVQPDGIFTGNGVSGYKLFPDIAGTGTALIKYTITDLKKCSASQTKTTVIRKALGSIDGIPGIICYNDTTFHIKINSLPDSITITGLSNTKNSLVYVPGTDTADYYVPDAGAGMDTLTFAYVWSGVNYKLTKVINIDSLILAEIRPLTLNQHICDNVNPIELTPTIPDGTFTGPVTAGYLDPKKAMGPATVTYKYTNPSTGCSAITSVPVIIYPAPVISFVPEDVCIESNSDTTFFTNNSTSADPVQSWKWKFSDLDGTHDTEGRDGAWLFKSGGFRKVSLAVTTINNCSSSVDSTFNLGIKPQADFYWISDCMKANDNVILIDTTISNSSIISHSWNIFNGTEFSTAAKVATYPKTAVGNIKVQYIVRTAYTGCHDTIIKDVFIRPSIAIQADGYLENFESGQGGWIKGETEGNTWSFGKPSRQIINTAYSGQSAWFTDFDRTKLQTENSSVTSPCFDFTELKRPTISIRLWKRFASDRDGTVLQYKLGDGKSWQTVGSIGDGIGWYNSPVIRGNPGDNQLGWTTIGSPDNNWNEGIHNLDSLVGKKDVKFRIAYGSDGTFPNHDGFAFDDIWIGERSRVVLLEHFTNMTQASSQSADSLVNKISTDTNEDVINIQYHTNFPYADSFYDATKGDASARILYYGLVSAPFTFIDGGSKKYYANIFDNNLVKVDSNDIKKESLIPAGFNLYMEPEISGGVLSIKKASITALGNIDSENLTLFLVVTEKSKTLNNVTYRNIFRKFIPDAGGIVLKNKWTRGETLNLPDQLWTIEKVLNNSSIEVIAFIQNSITREVYQAFSVTKTNIAVGLDDGTDESASGFSLYPNPAVNKITIAFGEPLLRETEVSILNMQGAVVRNYTAGSGLDEFIIEDAGLKAGIYLVRVRSGAADHGYKKLIITRD